MLSTDRHGAGFAMRWQDRPASLTTCMHASLIVIAGESRMLLRERYVRDLKAHVARYISILESIFGQRDPRFVFGTIEMSDDESPRTHFPDYFHFGGGCRVNILITKYPWENCSPDQGPWQVAHECVHLLDPREAGTINVLEEGLATWFQDESTHHDELVQHYIAKNDKPLPASYLEAQELVRGSVPDILHAVKKLRGSGHRIGDIKADVMAPLLPKVRKETLERLCSPFQG